MESFFPSIIQLHLRDGMTRSVCKRSEHLGSLSQRVGQHRQCYVLTHSGHSIASQDYWRLPIKGFKNVTWAERGRPMRKNCAGQREYEVERKR